MKEWTFEAKVDRIPWLTEQVDALLELARAVKAEGLDLMSYSGYTYEELVRKHDPKTDEFMGLLDILVDGRYVRACKKCGELIDEAK